MKVTDLRRKLAATLAACGMLAPSALRAADLNTNLVVNPGFENVDFTEPLGNYSAPHILDWMGTGFAYSHDGSGGIPDYANGGPLAGGGSFYFTSNRPGADITAPGVFFQDVNVAGGASGSLIATGQAAYNLSAFFSSYLTQGDFGTVHADFRNASSMSLGTAILTDSDTSQWGQDFKGGLIPVGTQTVRLSLFGTALAGGPDGYIDNVSFQVTNEVIQPFLDLTIDRDNGSMVIANRTGGPVTISGYSITSAFEGLAANWLSIADNYDSGNPGPNQVDAAHQWTELTDPAAHGDLSEADLASGAGASLGHTRTINLSNSGAWIKTPFEDLVFNYVSGGQVKSGIVTFVDNGGQPFAVGDLNTDSVINSADWMILRTNQHTNLSGQSLAEAYRLGDLTGDRMNNHPDFVAFKTAYDAANGVGAFAAMIASVPEPSGVVLITAAGLLAWPLGGRRARES